MRSGQRALHGKHHEATTTRDKRRWQRRSRATRHGGRRCGGYGWSDAAPLVGDAATSGVGTLEGGGSGWRGLVSTQGGGGQRSSDSSLPLSLCSPASIAPVLFSLLCLPPPLCSLLSPLLSALCFPPSSLLSAFPLSLVPPSAEPERHQQRPSSAHAPLRDLDSSSCLAVRSSTLLPPFPLSSMFSRSRLHSAMPRTARLSPFPSLPPCCLLQLAHEREMLVWRMAVQQCCSRAFGQAVAR